MPAIVSLIHDRRYNKQMRWLRSKKNPQRIASIRRRAFIGVMTRWWQEHCNGQPIRGAEVGVKYGGFTCDVLAHCPFIEWMYCIDPWEEYPADHPDREQFGYAGRDQRSWDWLYRRACEILAKNGDRARIWRTRSLDAADECMARGEQLDFVYLDAMHDYESVLADCENWWHVVRPGGVLCGDDWFPVTNFRRDNVGVSRAAEKFAGIMGLPLIGLHRSWFVCKPA